MAGERDPRRRAGATTGCVTAALETGRLEPMIVKGLTVGLLQRTASFSAVAAQGRRHRSRRQRGRSCAWSTSRAEDREDHQHPRPLRSRDGGAGDQGGDRCALYLHRDDVPVLRELPIACASGSTWRSTRWMTLTGSWITVRSSQVGDEELEVRFARPCAGACGLWCTMPGARFYRRHTLPGQHRPFRSAGRRWARRCCVASASNC